MSASPASVAATGEAQSPDRAAGLWVERLQLTNFRNYAQLSLAFGPSPVVLTGSNGAGKTNLLEALSLLTSGQGLRRAPFPEIAGPGGGAWAVWSRVRGRSGAVELGTGLKPERSETGRTGRVVHVDGEPQPTTALDDHLEMIWVTPALDGLFTGPASERRQFFDRLIACFDPGHRVRLGRYDRAMQQRNRLLGEYVADPVRFEAFERIMAENGVAIAAARIAIVGELIAAIQERRGQARHDAFPWAELAVSGMLETALSARAAVDVEDEFCAILARERERDRAAGRTLDGPHRSDFIVGHGLKEMPAKICSTGEQKALLIGLILAHADLVSRQHTGAAPLLLLDEITAHLDPLRRLALFDEIVAVGCQAWMSGTDDAAFSGLAGRAQFFRVEEGRVSPAA